MQKTKIKNVATKLRKKILKGFPTRNQYVPIKDENGKTIRHKLIVHLLKPFKHDTEQTVNRQPTENETRVVSNEQQS